MKEKRRFGRIPFGHAVNLRTEGETVVGRLNDLSLKGAKVSPDSETSLSFGARCRFELALADEVELTFLCQVVHIDEEHLGLKFIEADPESFAHLLRLMELNTGDAEKVADEMRHLGEN